MGSTTTKTTTTTTTTLTTATTTITTTMKATFHLFWRDSDQNFYWRFFGIRQQQKQAGAELCQAQVKLEVIVGVGVEFGV